MDGQRDADSPGSSTEPFWERYGMVSERSETEAGCNYTSLINVQCRREGDERGGRPSRKCERLIRRFRDCGRGREELESSREEFIDHNHTPGTSERLFRDPFQGQPQTRSAPLDSTIGEALEEFVEYAEELKRRAAASASTCDARAEPEQAAHIEAVSRIQPRDVTVPYEPWYSRFFHRRAQCSPGRQRPWEKFKEDFQEA